MNYTKTIRNYCLQNKGDLFDVSYMKDSYFEMVPYLQQRGKYVLMLFPQYISSLLKTKSHRCGYIAFVQFVWYNKAKRGV